MAGIWARSTLTAQCNYGVNSSNKDKTLLTCCKFLCRPKILAHAGLDGQFNFDKTLLALVGTKALVFLDPAKRNTCHKCMVCPLSKKHYRNYRFFIPETKAIEHLLGKIFPSTLQNASHRTRRHGTTSSPRSYHSNAKIIQCTI